jgi:hypothetical protein
MSKIVGAGILVMACVLTAPGMAQTASDVELTRAQIQTDRQAIIAAAMELTEEEAIAFWPAYRDYRVQMARIGDRLVKVLTELVEADAKLTDEQATRLLDEYLDLTADMVSIRKQHARKFRKLLPATKVTRFFQLEHKLDAVIQFELAATVPLTQ